MVFDRKDALFCVISMVAVTRPQRPAS